MLTEFLLKRIVNNPIGETFNQIQPGKFIRHLRWRLSELFNWYLKSFTMKNHLSVATLLVAYFLLIGVTIRAQTLVMQPLSTFGINGDGSIRPDERTYLNSTNELQRGMAYNPVTGHILVASRANSFGTDSIHVLDGATGEEIKTLDFTGSIGGNASFPLNLIGVADDGAIYVGNLTSSTTGSPSFNLFRWADEDSLQTGVFSGDPSNGNTNNINKRWGDTLAVRGSGLDTQILLASRGTLAAVFTPTDASMTSFAATTLNSDVATGALGYGLTFGTGNTFWGTGGANSGGPLLQLSFNLAAGTATTIHTFDGTVFPRTVTPISVFPFSNLLAGIDTHVGADFVRLYDISNLTNPPVLLDRKSFVTTNNNSVFSGAVSFSTNNILYALDTDNGLMAFTIASAASNNLAPSIYLSPANRIVSVGSNVVFEARADGAGPLSYQWFFEGSPVSGATGTSYIVNNAQTTNTGSFSVVATNGYGSATSSVASLNVLTTAPGLITYDFFNYSPGTVLGTANGANNGWIVTSGASGTVEAGNLDVPGLAASTGNRYIWTSTASNTRLPIGTNISGEIYFSFALRIDTVGNFSGSDTIAGLGFGTSTSFSYKLNVQTNGGGGYNLGIFKGGGVANGSFATNNFSNTDMVFVVGRYTFNAAGGSDDTCDLWLNPDSSTFGKDIPPAPTIAAIGNGVTDNAQIDKFLFRAAGAPSKHTADEVRVGINWSSVTPPAAQAKPPSLMFGLSGSSFTLTWPANATGYNLQGSPTIAPTTWTAVTNPVTVSGTNNTVTLNSITGTRFFRLIK